MGYSTWSTLANQNYWQTRAQVIDIQEGAGDLFVNCCIGDSITEAIPTSWGYSNCGLAYAGIADINETIPPLLPTLVPVRAFVMAGVNDTAYSVNDTLQLWMANGEALVSQWVATYDALLRSLIGVNCKVALFTILPLAAVQSNNFATRNPVIQMLNGKIHGIANYFNLPVFDGYSLFANPQGNAIPAFMQADGVHPASPGYQVLQPLYAQAAQI